MNYVKNCLVHGLVAVSGGLLYCFSILACHLVDVKVSVIMAQTEPGGILRSMRMQVVTPVTLWVKNKIKFILVSVYPSSIAPDVGPVRVSCHFVFHGFHGRRVMNFELAFYTIAANFKLWSST